MFKSDQDASRIDVGLRNKALEMKKTIKREGGRYAEGLLSNMSFFR